MSTARNTSLDDLIEGRLRAVRTPTKAVTLYRMTGFVSTVIAVFNDEEAFSLMGGYVTVEQFNEAMGKRRAQFEPPFRPGETLTPGMLG